MHTVPSDDVLELVGYINRHYDQLLRNNTALEDYLEEAVEALRDDDIPRARKYIEKGLIVKDCSALSSAQMTQYFKLMHHGDNDSAKKFKQRFDTYMAHCREKAKSKAPASTAQLGSNRDRDAPSGRDTRYSTTTPSMPRPIPGRRPSVDVGSRGSYKSDEHDRHKITEAMQNMQVSSVKYSTSIDRHSDGKSGRRVLPSSLPNRPETKQLSRDTTGSDGQHGWRTLQNDSDTLSGEPTIRGPKKTEKTDDPLDPKYYRRTPTQAGKLFKKGCVFSVLEHKEYTGPRAPEQMRSNEGWLTKTRQGVWVISHIRRFAVVREGHGFCKWLPLLGVVKMVWCSSSTSPSRGMSY